MLTYYQLDPKKHISKKFTSDSKFFIQENAFENAVCNMVAILSQPLLITERSAHTVDSFTVPLHSSYIRQGTVTVVWKMVGIPTGYMIP